MGLKPLIRLEGSFRITRADTTAAGMSKNAGDAATFVTEINQVEIIGAKPPKQHTAKVYPTVIQVLRRRVGKISQIVAGPGPEYIANSALKQHCSMTT